MQLALAHNQSVDAVAIWLAFNQAGYCQRMRATITAAACASNQKQSSLDCRCDGCGGLDNQPEKMLQPPPINLLWDADLQPDLDADKEEEQHNELTKCKLYDEELDELLEDYFSDEDDESLDDDNEDNQQIYLEDPPEPQGRRVPVYVGRCPRCGGYMVNTSEKQFNKKDDHVYRCFNCGWRTSLEYENNRSLMLRGAL